MTLATDKDTKDTVVAFASQVPNSTAFAGLFTDTMLLVEDTAAYLDNDGRKQAKLLQKDVPLVYARASMRLTAKLMAMASWALSMRTVKEGEHTIAWFKEQVRKNRFATVAKPQAEQPDGRLPAKLLELLRRTETLLGRMRTLDRIVHDNRAAARIYPVGQMHDKLRSEFGQEPPVDTQ